MTMMMMSSSLFLIVLWTITIVLSLLLPMNSSQLIFPSDQFQALEDLYDATNGMYWTWNTNQTIWNFTNPNANPCLDNWQGIVCINSTSEYGVQVLFLQSYNLTGTIPASIENLQNMTEILLAYNDLYGNIPAGLFTIPGLEYIDLQHNFLSGSLPSLSKLTKLRNLYLNVNQLSKNLPNSWKNMKDLTMLYLSENSFTSSLPSSIYELTALDYFVIFNNKFTGSLSSNFSNLQNLEYFYANNNDFFGSLTSTILPPKLVYFEIANNSLTGVLPPTFYNVNGLKVFVVASNQLHGEVPVDFLSELPKLQCFSVGFNFLHGNVLHFAENATNLNILGLEANQLTNTLPLVTKYIENYAIGNNYLTGEIPIDFFSPLTRIQSINLENNFFHGQFFLNYSYPTYLNISYNFFTGNIENIFNYFDDPLKYNRSASPAQIIVNNNQFTGTFPINQWQYFPSVTMISISNNQLTGKLSMWPSTIMSGFAATANCFHDIDLTSFCSASQLQVLILNGLSSASECQMKLFPNTIIEPFINKYSFYRTIPSCFYRMNRLNILQLSGNGFTGSLPSNQSIAKYLRNIVFSHNRLTGTIPMHFQKKQWFTLDLSYNYLTGTLSNSFHNYSHERSLTLKVNRLSGDIPSSLLNADQINILDGNMFTCDFHKSSLPSNDPNRNNYSCGSDSVNLSLIVWLAIGAVCFVVLLLGAYFFKRICCCFSRVSSQQFSENLHQLLEAFRFFHSFCSTESAKANDPSSSSSALDQKRNGLLSLWIFNQRARRMCFALLFCIIGMLLPSYLVLSRSASNYSYQDRYAWILSALYLHGGLTAIVLFAEFFGFVLFFVVCFVFLWLIDFSFSSMQWNPLLISNNNSNEEQSTEEIDWTQRSRQRQKYFFFAFLAFVNFVFMMAADVFYVYIVINYATIYITLAEIALAVIKLFWNNHCLWYFLDRFHRYQSHTNNENNPNQILPSSESEITFLFLNISLNNLIYPIIAIMIISSNCFNNAFFPASDVTSYYSIIRITSSEQIPMTFTSSYTPPFSYSFQCSSVIYAYYCPVFVVTFVFESILFPFCHLVWIASRGDKESPPLLPASSPSMPSLPSMSSLDQSTEGVNQNDQQVEPRASEQQGSRSTFFYRPSASITTTPAAPAPSPSESDPPSENDRSNRTTLVSLLTSLVSVVFTSSRSLLQTSPGSLFDRNRYAVRFNSYFLVLVAYGAIFPPLALLVVISLLLRTAYEETLLGRTLLMLTAGAELDEAARQRALAQLRRDCRGLMTPMKYSLVIVVPIATILFSYLIFDSFGRDEELFVALSPFFALFLFPTVAIALGTWQMNRSLSPPPPSSSSSQGGAVAGGKDSRMTLTTAQSFSGLRPSLVNSRLTLTTAKSFSGMRASLFSAPNRANDDPMTTVDNPVHLDL